MKLLRWLWREPLVHFLLAGAAIYVVFALIGKGGDNDHRQITVSRAALLQYMQYRAKAFEPTTFSAQFDALSANEKQSFINDYVREEVLYREAKSLGLEQGDYVMRQRLIQKMMFLLESSLTVKPSEAVLQTYLTQHEAEYVIASSTTFTHVFVDASKPNAKVEAEQLLATLNRRHAGFNDAPQFGDRFPYLQNYIERTEEYIGSQFGVEFVTELQKLNVDSRRWQGPIHSQLGWHVVLLTARTAERHPSLDELREQVTDDYKRDQLATDQQLAIEKLIAAYRIDTGDLKPSP